MDLSILQQGYPFCIELLIATLLFELSLNKKRLFLLRVLLAAVFMAGELLLYSALAAELGWIWFLIVFLTDIAAVRFCCEVSWIDALYCAALAYATAGFTGHDEKSQIVL